MLRSAWNILWLAEILLEITTSLVMVHRCARILLNFPIFPLHSNDSTELHTRAYDEILSVLAVRLEMTLSHPTTKTRLFPIRKYRFTVVKKNGVSFAAVALVVVVVCELGFFCWSPTLEPLILPFTVVFSCDSPFVHLPFTVKIFWKFWLLLFQFLRFCCCYCCCCSYSSLVTWRENIDICLCSAL